MRPWLAHYLNPLHIWCRLPRSWKGVCVAYERWVFKPILRRIFDGSKS
jgi:hypothetical protein